MFSFRNKKNISTFLLKKSTLTRAMNTTEAVVHRAAYNVFKDYESFRELKLLYTYEKQHAFQ